ncbi:cytochrome c oxidase assembly protein [Marinovum sp.]|uniref:cytochrome c oxidase assembly protein n=1 Tax=Marinovum sp. TaxID=2024839 RepID=UPI002B266F4B|nr:cytochrome c oxidase assembly protein [Marinovum sp.]
MTRAAALGAVALLAALYLPAWPALIGPFPAHMLRHMGLVAGVAPLVVLAWPGLARRAGLPVVLGAGLEFVVVWAWHLPLLHMTAQTGAFGKALEQAMFLGAGWAVWASALSAREPMAGAGGLFLTSVHMTMLGALLVLAPGDLYAEICGRAPDLSGQQLGGLLMLAIGTPVYLFGGLALMRRGLQGGLT